VLDKYEDCINCDLLTCGGPVDGEFTNEGEVDILFVGEALGFNEVIEKQPFIGEAGQLLRRTLKGMGYTSYGISNVARCKPPGNDFPGLESIGEHCQKALQADLDRCAKIVVPLGATALQAITGMDVGISKIQGRLFSSNGHVILPMYHPSFLNRRGQYWRDWEFCHTKLDKFLKGKTDYIAPESRIVTQVGADELPGCLRELQKPEYPILNCDIETSAGYAPWAGAHIISMSIAWSKTHSIAFDWNDVTGESRKLLEDLFADLSKIWEWYNGQYDSQFLFAEAFQARLDSDVMVRAHLVDERGSSEESAKGGIYHSLKRDSAFHLDADNWEADVKIYAPGKDDDYSVIPREKLLEYNGLDTIHGRHLSQVLEEYMIEEGTVDYYGHVVMPTYNMLARARYVGFRVDVRRTQSLQSEMQPVLDELLQLMIELSGDRFLNPNAPAQVKAVLWAKGLKVENTRKETLAAYEGDEFVDALRDYRDCSKMLSTYVVGLANCIYDDLRVHPDWRLPTETGRPRCGDPNLLGMPRKAEVEEHKWKRYIKEQFIADPGTILLHLDRKQSEVRCMVFLANCLAFIEHLIEIPKADIHGEFTKTLYGAGYTKEQRVLVKMIVFGLIYNREAPSLASQLTAIEREKAYKLAESTGVRKSQCLKGAKTEIRSDGKVTYKVWSIREAQRFINDFFKLFPEMVSYKEVIIEEALREGVLRGYLGRVRRFGNVTWDRRQHTSNEAVNFMPSNLSADLNFLSCVETMRQFGKYGVELLVPIHDAGLFRIPADSKYLVDEIVNLWEGLTYKELTRPGLPLEGHDPRVPFPVDVSTGERWSDL